MDNAFELVTMKNFMCWEVLLPVMISIQLQVDPTLRPNIDEIVKRLEDCIVDEKRRKQLSKAQG